MTIGAKEIIESCAKLSICEKRKIIDKYAEIVFFSKEQKAWDELLSNIFGPAIKPAGVEPSQDDQDFTSDQGGIYTDQTLFKKEFDDVTAIAMFWPWQDGIHTTLKIIFF